MLRDLLARVRAVFQARALDRNLDDEFQSHLEMLTAEHVRAGMTPAEAARAARIRLGDTALLKEQHRETRGLPLLDTILQDTRYALRALRRDAGLATFAILIVGIGVGASATVFSAVDALLLRPLPFADPDGLVWIKNDLGTGLSAETVQVGHMLDFRGQNQSFSDVAAYFAFYGAGDSVLTDPGDPERLTSVPVSESFFRLLGVQPAHGRLFTEDECRWKGPKAALLSHRLWATRFRSDPGLIGRALTLNQEPVTVVGILPASFDFGTVFAPGRRVDLFVPFPLGPETNNWGNTLSLVGRLKPGSPVEAARAEALVLGERIKREHPDRNNVRFAVSPLREHVSGPFRSAMVLLSCAVGMVMVIVCTNLSNLLLGRSASRRREMAIRAALGAARPRLIQQVLTESVLLSSGGAALGVALALIGTRVLSRLDAVNIALLDQVRLDGWALGFALSTAVVTGIAFGLMPALRLSALAPYRALKESGRGTSEGSRHGWTRRALVVSEIALACALLAGAGLLIRSFTRVLDLDLGFRPLGAMAVRLDPGPEYSTQALRNNYLDEVLRRVRALPGVNEAGVSDSLPLGPNRSWGISVRNKTFAPGKGPDAFVRMVSDGYLQAMGIPLVAGRDFTPHDTASGEPVIIVNEMLARTMWPGEDAIGRIMRTDQPERRVVGVVHDVRHLALEEESGFEMYIPYRQSNDVASIDLVVRGTDRVVVQASAVRAALRPIDPTLAASEFRQLQDVVDRSVSPRRFLMLLLGGFAAFALILSALGIYGVIAYSVSQRKQEIGIRMALGASARDVRASVLAQTLKLAAVGVAAGSIGAWFLGRLIQGLLFGVTSTDPATFAAVAVLLMLVAALAGYLPARQASRVNPLEALRTD